MPDTTAHHYFGQEVYKELRDDIRAFLSAHKSIFDLGLQGPDLLFYYKPFRSDNPVRALGIGIHHQPARGRMQAAAEALRQKTDEAALAYLLGYACHWALDSAFHGDIARMAPSSNEHFQLEAELDRQIILGHYARNPLRFSRWRLTQTDMAGYGWLRTVYPELNDGECRECAQSITYFMRLINAQTPLRLAAAAVAERLSGHPGMFRSTMVPRRLNVRFQAAAGQLYARLEGVATRGVAATEAVWACVQEDMPLPELFQKDFE